MKLRKATVEAPNAAPDIVFTETVNEDGRPDGAEFSQDSNGWDYGTASLIAIRDAINWILRENNETVDGYEELSWHLSEDDEGGE